MNKKTSRKKSTKGKTSKPKVVDQATAQSAEATSLLEKAETPEEIVEPTLKGVTEYVDDHLVTPGDIVSINLANTKSIRFGEMRLNHAEYKATVPMHCASEVLRRINAALHNDYIVKGDVDTRPHKDEKVVDTYLDQLNLRSLIDIQEAIVGVTRCLTRISGWAPKEILEMMRKKESDTLNRRAVVDYLEQALRHVRPVGATSEKFDPTVHMTRSIRYNPQPKRFGK